MSAAADPGQAAPQSSLADDDEISEDQFYEWLGRPDLRARLRRRTRVRGTGRVLGAVFGGLGFLSLVVALPVVAYEIPRSSPDWGPAVGGLAGATGGLALLSITSYLISARSPHPIELSEMQDPSRYLLASRDRPVPCTYRADDQPHKQAEGHVQGRVTFDRCY